VGAKKNMYFGGHFAWLKYLSFTSSGAGSKLQPAHFVTS
jgi:hypothetical protein